MHGATLRITPSWIPDMIPIDIQWDLAALAKLLRRFAEAPQPIAVAERIPGASSRNELVLTPADDAFGMRDLGGRFAWRLNSWQAERIASLLGSDSKLVVVTTTGDARPDTPIHDLGGTGVFVKEVEQALIGHVPDDAFIRAACESCRKLDAMEDVHASASYRQHLATVMSRRALEKAYARATGKA